jgi:serine phosphatase RsbU (regulator of sigma subunit)
MPATELRHASVPGPRQEQPLALTLLVVGEDPSGAFTVPDILDASRKVVRIRHARNLTEAERLLTHDISCVLLDLTGDAQEGGGELEDLRQVLRIAPATPVLVVTREADADRAAEAVRIGAQDHLSVDELDGSHLSRAIRYAVERKRADRAQRQLAETRLLAQENARLERGLLPRPMLDGAGIGFSARYRPGRSRALLGGDFFDTVRTPDGTVHAMIGDVSGHGPDEAALGVELRIAWRALTLAGLSGATVLATLQQVLENERASDEIFATLCAIDILPGARTADLYLAGHPSPLLAGPRRAPTLLPSDKAGPALGLLTSWTDWGPVRVELGDSWSLMLYTDGLIEGRVGDGTERLGQDGMVRMLCRLHADGLRERELLDAAVTEARELNGGELTDDVALVLLNRNQTRQGPGKQ